MFTRNLKLIALALPLMIGVAACGGSDDGTSAPPPVVADNDPANTAKPADDSGTPKANEAVEAFCTQVDEFVEASQKLIDDPASADVTKITKQGTDLAAAASTLATSTTPADSARLQECTAKFADIGT